MMWNVYVPDGLCFKWIDKVWFLPELDAKYVRDRLVNHDSYPYDIIVRKA